jgi:hypothetical protein
MNYNEEVTTHIVNEYNKEPSTETVQKLSEELGKSTKSIIGKLSREGVYQRATYKNKTGELPVTKVELVNNIAENLGIEVENLLGLEKAPKATLKYLDLATGIEGIESNAEEKLKPYIRDIDAKGNIVDEEV